MIMSNCPSWQASFRLSPFQVSSFRMNSVHMGMLRSLAVLCALCGSALGMDPAESWRSLNAEIATVVVLGTTAGPIANQDEATAKRVKAVLESFVAARDQAGEDRLLPRSFAEFQYSLSGFVGALVADVDRRIASLDKDGAQAHAAAVDASTQRGRAQWKARLILEHLRYWRVASAVVGKPQAWIPFPVSFGLGDPAPMAEGVDGQDAPLDDRGFFTAIAGCSVAHRAMARHAIAQRKAQAAPAALAAGVAAEQRQLDDAVALGATDRGVLTQRVASATAGSFAADAANAALAELDDPIAGHRGREVFARSLAAWLSGVATPPSADGSPAAATAEEAGTIADEVFLYRANECSPAHRSLAERMTEHAAEEFTQQRLKDQLSLYEQLMAAAIKADATQRALAPILLPQLQERRHLFQAAMLEGAMSAWKDPAGWQKADAGFQKLFTEWVATKPVTAPAKPAE